MSTVFRLGECLCFRNVDILVSKYYYLVSNNYYLILSLFAKILAGSIEKAEMGLAGFEPATSHFVSGDANSLLFLIFGCEPTYLHIRKY